MTSSSVSYSSFLRGPSDVVPRLDGGDVVLERRDGEDLVLSTMPRVAAFREGLDVSVGALRLIIRTNPELVVEGLREELPWISWLPADEQGECVRELLNDLAASLGVENFTRFHNDLVAWRSTAEVWADPHLAEELQRDLAGDSGRVKRPARG